MVIETFKEDFIFNFLSFYFASWRNLDWGKKKGNPKWDDFILVVIFFYFEIFFCGKKNWIFFSHCNHVIYVFLI
jgi:hypothetical protein